MADITALDAKTGQPVTLPQEAVASEYAKGAIVFASGTRVPVVWNGQEGTVDGSKLEEATQRHGATLNFDPGGAIKAAAAGVGRGASLGLTDWLAIEGQKLYGTEEQAEKTRKALKGLQEDHPGVSFGAELGGAIGAAFVPGGAEVEGGRLLEAGEIGARGAEALGAGAEAARGVDAANEARAAAEATQGAVEGAKIRQAADAGRAIADTDAASGRTVGSALGSLFRNANPNAIVGRAGQAAENAIAPLFGEGRAARAAGMLARVGTEGAFVDLANAADEAELGDTDITGETILASIEHGALWGSLLGLAGTGAERALVGASRLASRVAEGRLGGTAGMYRKGLARWGPGALGNRALEEGIETPFATAEEKFQRAKAVVGRDGEQLDGIAREADAAYGGMDAAASRAAYHQAIDEAAERGALGGGNLDALKGRLKREYDEHIGWKGDPTPMDPIPPDTADRLYDHAWREESARTGLVDPSTPPPREVSGTQVRARWRELADAEGLGTRLEKPPKGLKPSDIEAYRQKVVSRFQAATDLAERQRLGVELATPGALEAGARVDIEASVASRNARRGELRTLAADELGTRYAMQRDAWEKAMARHTELRAAAARTVAEKQGERDRTFAHMVSAVRRRNADLRVPFTSVRAFRAKLDDIIPYNRAADAMTNAAVDMKHAARGALEKHVEDSIERAAAKSGNPELRARYAHAKMRYGQAKDIEKMIERQRGREASWFGREVFGHNGGLIGHGIAGLMFGHPVAGVAAGVARKHAPPVLAWAAHKLGRMAELKALRAEVQVAMRRSARAAAAGREVPRFARVGVPDLPPHQLRASAAEAMLAVMKAGKNGDLAARIAALDPSLPLLAPKSSAALEGAARRALTWMLSRIPRRVQTSLAQGHEITGRELSDSEARDFLEAVAVAHDPRVATDALARGQLTPTMAKGFKSVTPSLAGQMRATLAREMQTDRESFEALPHARRAQAAMLGATLPGQPAAMTLALQQAAAMSAGGASARPAPAGKTNAASGLSKMTLGSTLMTATQALEGTAPGRRGRRSVPGGM